MRARNYARPALTALVCAVVLAISGCKGGKKEETSATATTPPNPPAEQKTEPLFKKEGMLWFIHAAGDTAAVLDLEVAASDPERTQGLMFRTNIDEKTAMIFLFQQPDYQSFWMKNTPSTLDIMFISPEKKILNIHEFTTPFSEQSYPANGLSNIVVEVKGGFSQKYKLKAGDRIEYKLDAETPIL